MPHKKIVTRLKETWEDNTESHVHSESIYNFDLDTNTLHVEDYDFIFIGKNKPDSVLPVGLHSYKKIRHSAQDINAYLFELPLEFSEKNLVLGTKLNSMTFVPQHEVDGTHELKNILMDVKQNHRFEAGKRYRLSLDYKVKLEAINSLFLFTGAIQPADYEVARTKLLIDNAKKSITLILRKKNKFSPYLFNPAEMNYFPNESDIHFEKNQYRFMYDFPTIMKNYGRAHYFTLAAKT
jgi:hypothetical protein